MHEPGSEIDAIRRSLAAAGLPMAVEWVAETASTNSDLVDRVRASRSLPEPTFRVAESQTAGRGRHGRRWHATPGAALTFSFCRRLAATDPSGLSLAVGTALADALDPPAADTPIRVGLKWPNDLWLLDPPSAAPRAGRKLGGVLIESVANAAGERAVVIGVGINVLPQPVPEAASGFACMQEIDAGVTPLRLLASLAAPLATALALFDSEGWAAFADRFAGRDVLLGRAVRAGSDEGVAAGVSASGELLVRTERGLARIVSGDVRVQALAGSSC